jgi:hypothetical protein
MKITTQPDLQKAQALIQMAQISYKRLQETNKEEYPSNSISDYYDIIHKLMEAVAAKKGIKFKEQGAHQQLINYLKEENIINEQTRILIQELREQRNRIQYEGYNIHKNYLIQQEQQLESTIDSLRKEITKK